MRKITFYLLSGLMFLILYGYYASENGDAKSLNNKKTQETIFKKRQKKISMNEVDQIIRKQCREKYHLRPEFIKAIIKVESNFNIYAISPKGAMGLMQLMPKTADSLNVTDPFDPTANIGGGCKYISKHLKEFRNTYKALVAYNAGPVTIRDNKAVPGESRLYAKRVLRFYNDYRYKFKRGKGE